MQTRKENFLKFIDNAIASEKGIEVSIENPKEPTFQSVGNSNTYLPTKKRYYEQNFDSELRFINDKSILIKEYRVI